MSMGRGRLYIPDAISVHMRYIAIKMCEWASDALSEPKTRSTGFLVVHLEERDKRRKEIQRKNRRTTTLVFFPGLLPEP